MSASGARDADSDATRMRDGIAHVSRDLQREASQKVLQLGVEASVDE